MRRRFAFWWEQEVDRAKFLKLFKEGVKDAGKLSSTAAQVFHIVQQQVMGNPGRDEVKLNKYVAADYGLSDRTYRRVYASSCRRKFCTVVRVTCPLFLTHS